MRRLSWVFGLLVIATSLWLLMIASRPSIKFARVVFQDGTLVTAELAANTFQRQKGLSGHDPLREGEGMLFLHEQKEIPTYWMKDMRFPIDLIWIDENQVVGMHMGLEPENSPKTLYRPDRPINRVIELPSGFISTHQVTVGDRLDITFLSR
ncbi:DUF192 domain-containing protein [Candidatus Uhrbacteria bacterium]|nr:DUF192 domain-containing protein [Candidatus Uhrbacteria bacterium]